jgi:hypothetical protein
MKKYLIALAILFLPVIASGQTRLNLGADHAGFSVNIEDYYQGFRWYFISAEIEQQFKNKWIPGFAVGMLKEGRKSEYNGTYFTVKTFYALDFDHFSVIPYGGLLYGLPGIQFDRTNLLYKDGEVVGYLNVSMIRHINVSPTNIDTAGVLQPISGLTLRKYLGSFFVDGHANLRFARFSKVTSDFSDASYDEELVLMPSLGLGIGYTF